MEPPPAISRSDFMLTTLAQIPNAVSTEMGPWLVNGAAFAAIVLIVLQIISYFKAKPPLHSQFADRFETDKRFDDIEAKIEKSRDDQRRQYDALMAADEHRAKELHDRINDVLRAVSRLEGKMEDRS